MIRMHAGPAEPLRRLAGLMIVMSTRFPPPVAGDGVRAVSLRAALQSVGSAQLAGAKCRALDKSMADGRRGVTQQGVRWWIVLTVWGWGISPLPDPYDRSVDTAALWEVRLEDFVVWVCYARPSGRQVSFESAGKYASHVRGWVRKVTVPRIELGLGAAGSRIQAILRGYARDVEQPPKQERVGVTPEDLARGLLAGACSAAWCACLTFMMVALARGIEVSLGDDEAFEESEHMMPSDVSFETFQARRLARVTMRKRKDLKVLRGKHAEVVLAGGEPGAHFDAVARLEEWLAERRRLGIPEDRPLFCHTERPWQGFTVREVRDEVKRIMALIGRNPALYGAHSLRIGGATAALAAGVPPQLIRLMGRWSSDVYEIYCRMSLQSAMGVGRAIAGAMVTGMGEKFEDEHLELLPSERDQVAAEMGDEGTWDIDEEHEQGTQ